MPPESFSYRQAQAELAQVQEIREKFNCALKESRQTQNFTQAKALKAELEGSIAALQERLFPLERELHLKEQYASQEAILEKSGILQTLPSGEQGIFGIDGKAYPLPSIQEVMARLREKYDILKEKAAQSFTKLLLVPFGMPLDDLSALYGTLLKKHHAEGKLWRAKATDTDPAVAQAMAGTPDEVITDLDTATPLWRWDAYNQADKNGTLIYDPQVFSKENHGGKTKAQILAENPKASAGWLASHSLARPAKPWRSGGDGWRILLVEQNPIIPREGQGEENGGRRRLEANQTPQAYSQTIGQGSYAHESGLTPEDWLIQAITQLEEKNQVLDDWQGKGSIAYLTGAYFPASDVVSTANWSHVYRQVYLGWYVPRSCVGDFGARSAVRV